ncbi:MAG: alpha/beta fold hydrolase [Flavobacteriales bacterium]
MRFILFITFLTFGNAVLAQQSYNTWNFDGTSREYISYVPSSYNASTPTPVVFCLHGLGDSMSNFYQIGMNAIADTANFIAVFPQALVDPLSNATAWNSGAGAFGISLNPTVDDVGFINAIIDTLMNHFNIDETRIYACGFSMGGFMSNRLACELNGRIAAIASVAGTIGGELNCNPTNPIPVCHFHGTTDGTVGYTNNLFGNDAEELCEFWRSHNSCDASPEVIDIPDAYSDGYTVKHWIYANCVEHGDVELFKVIGADHIWMTPLNDINYSAEIWKFFYRQQLPAEYLALSEKEEAFDWNVYPNPATEYIIVQTANPNVVHLELIDISGSLKKTEQFRGTTQIQLSNLSSGLYLLKLQMEDGSFKVEHIIKN